MALRQLFLSRNLHTCKALRSAVSLDASAGHDEAWKKWKKLFFIGCIPCLVIGYLNVALEDHHDRPEYVEYPYLRVRNKKFPWRDGVKSLFHHPYFNALPGGYEENVSPPEPSWLYTLVKGSKH